MPLDAFGTRRVTESLRAIQKYLASAAQIAAGVPPGEVLSLDTEEIEISPSPLLTSVRWPNGTRVIALPDSTTTSDGQTTLEVTVTGENLADATTFKLVGVGPNAPFFATDQPGGAISDNDEDGFVATIVVQEPSEGVYDAKFVNAVGQTFILSRACRIELAAFSVAGGRKQKRGRRRKRARRRTTRSTTPTTQS